MRSWIGLLTGIMLAATAVTGISGDEALADNNAWELAQVLNRPDGADSTEHYATSAALHGDVVAVGSPTNVGKVYIYEGTNNGHELAETVAAPPGTMSGNFGASVALSKHYLVVAESNFTDEPTVHVFLRADGGFQHTAELTADAFGEPWSFVRSLHVAGGRIVVESPNGVYVFAEQSGDWDGVAKLPTAGSSAASGNRIAVSSEGSIYVYKAAGDDWIEEAVITASEPLGRVAISGRTIVAGASGYWNDVDPNLGAAFVFRYKGGTWQEEAHLTVPDDVEPDVWSWFGWEVSADASTVAIGRVTEYADDGEVYVYERRRGHWVESSRLTTPPIFAFYVGFPSFVAIDGDTLIAGTSTSHAGSGVVNVYTKAAG